MAGGHSHVLRFRTQKRALRKRLELDRKSGICSSLRSSDKGGIDEQADRTVRYYRSRHGGSRRIVAAGNAARLGLSGEALFPDAAGEGPLTFGAPAKRRHSAGRRQPVPSPSGRPVVGCAGGG